MRARLGEERRAPRRGHLGRGSKRRREVAKSPMGKGQDESAVARPLYSRAGRSSDRVHTAAPYRVYALFHLTCCPPPPVFVCVLLCSACLRVSSSPRDRWLCVLPRWQMNE